jgi:hypothetical protein
MAGFFLQTLLNEGDTMRGWFLFAIIAFLVFGIPLIDELYRRRVLRATNRARPIVHEPVSLVPDDGAQDPIRSDGVAPVATTKEYVA